MAVEVATQPARKGRIGWKPVLVVVGLVVCNVAWWWFSGPDGSAWGFSGLPTETSVACEVTHDGFLYPAKEEEFVLAPGEIFSGRFGPHDVRVSFLDNPGKRGLEIRRASRTLGFTTTHGSSIGTPGQDKNVTTGLGLGTLVVLCRH